jgi:hypothetical protein
MEDGNGFNGFNHQKQLRHGTGANEPKLIDTI